MGYLEFPKRIRLVEFIQEIRNIAMYSLRDSEASRKENILAKYFREHLDARDSFHLFNPSENLTHSDFPACGFLLAGWYVPATCPMLMLRRFQLLIAIIAIVSSTISFSVKYFRTTS